jgi:hypothetical protein
MTEQWNAELSSLAPAELRALTQSEIDQRVFDLYDEYCHGQMDRRAFLQRAAVVTIGGLTMAQALLPRYAQAQTISFTDERIKARYVTYPSPGGTSGTMRGYLVQPSGPGPFTTVLVIHENRGLNPYIEDVARRVAIEGFLALAPDGLSRGTRRWVPRQRRRRTDAPGGSRPGQTAYGYGQQLALSEIARTIHWQAWSHRLLLGW